MCSKITIWGFLYVLYITETFILYFTFSFKFFLINFCAHIYKHNLIIGFEMKDLFSILVISNNYNCHYKWSFTTCIIKNLNDGWSSYNLIKSRFYPIVYNYMFIYSKFLNYKRRKEIGILNLFCCEILWRSLWSLATSMIHVRLSLKIVCASALNFNGRISNPP